MSKVEKASETQLPNSMEEIMELIASKQKEKLKVQKLVDKASEDAKKRMAKIQAKREAYLLTLKEEEAEVKKDMEKQVVDVKEEANVLTKEIQNLIRHMSKINNG